MTLGGCAGSDLFNMAKVMRDAVVPESAPSVDRATIDKLPYATLLASVGDGPQTLIVLATDDNGSLTWVASDRVVVVTRHGRITRTAGLIANLTHCAFLDADPVGGPESIAPVPPTGYRRLIDCDSPAFYDSPIESSLINLGAETIDIAGQKHTTIHLREDNNVQSVGWSFENHFWADPEKGFVWKSVQNLSPNIAPLTVAIGKPYLG